MATTPKMPTVTLFPTIKISAMYFFLFKDSQSLVLSYSGLVDVFIILWFERGLCLLIRATVHFLAGGFID